MRLEKSCDGKMEAEGPECIMIAATTEYSHGFRPSNELLSPTLGPG